MPAKADAAKAVQNALQASLDLLMIVRFSNGGKRKKDAEEAVGLLLKATKCAMELAGFHPDEKERGALYRMIVDYIGEDH